MTTGYKTFRGNKQKALNQEISKNMPHNANDQKFLEYIEQISRQGTPNTYRMATKVSHLGNAADKFVHPFSPDKITDKKGID